MTALIELFLAFLKIGFLSFGGVSMIPAINDVMLTNGWMTLAEVGDIVAIAEMTPGALGVNCSTFVGVRVGGVIGAFVALLGILTPSFVVCVFAAVFFNKFKGNPYLEAVMTGIRPVIFGLILSVAVTLAKFAYISPGTGYVLWAPVAIAVIVGLGIYYGKISIPKIMLIAGVLGALLG